MDKAFPFRAAGVAALILIATTVTGTASAQAIAANALSSVASEADREALANISISDDQLTIPALSRHYLITLHAYASGNGGGDNSTADLKLYVNEGLAASRHDQRFNSYTLDIRHSFVSSTLQPTKARYVHTNHIAAETATGLEVVDIKPI